MSDNIYMTKEQIDAMASELFHITEATKALSESSNELERASVHTAAATATLTPPLEHLYATTESGARAAGAQAEGVKSVGSIGGFILSSAEATLQLMGFGDQSDGTGSALSRLAGDINEAAEALGVFREKRTGLVGEVEDTTWSEDWHKATTELRESMDWHDWINLVSNFKALWTLPQD